MRMRAPWYSGRFRTNSGSCRQAEKRASSKPVFVTRFRNTAGMIWSVSTFERRSGTAVPVTVLILSISALLPFALEIPRARERSANGGRRSDERGDEVGATALALPALEVAVGGRCAAFAWRQLVGVHSEAHRATREAPLGAELLDHLVEALGLGFEPDSGGAGHDHDAHAVRLVLALDDRRERAEVFDAAVRARAHEDGVDVDILQRRSGLEGHVLEGALCGGA